MLREAIVLRPADANLYNAFAVLCLDHDSFQVGIDMLNVGLQDFNRSPIFRAACSMRNYRISIRR